MVSLDVEWVRYGRPAAERLRGALAAIKQDEALAPATVIVPSNHVGVVARRLLASGALGPICPTGTGLAAVTFLTVYRLGELLGAAGLAAAGRRPVSTPVVAAALRASLAEDPGIFGPVASHPSTEAALVAAYRELRDVSSDALDALGRRSPRAFDVVRLHRSTRARLERTYYDEEDLLDAAVAALEADPRPADELGSVVVYLPERMTRHGAGLVRTVADGSEVLVLAGSVGNPGADTEVARSLRRLGAPAAGVPPPGGDPLSMVDTARTRVVTTSDADEEVREAVRAVMAAVRAGTPLDRIAVLFASPDPYARLAFEHLNAAGIDMNGSAVVPVAARMAGRTLVGLLDLPASRFRRSELFAWLAGARLRHRGRPVPITAWERLSRDAGVVEGRQQWDDLLTRLAVDHDEQAALAEADPDAPPWRAEQERTRADRARELRDFVLGLIDDLDEAGRGLRPWPDRSRWARDRLGSLLGGPAHRRHWPVAEERAAERVERALDRLGRLGDVEGPVGLDVFARSLELELEADLGRVGRIGEGVFVGPVGMGAGLDLDLVVVVGLSEGTFPAAVRDDSLLPDRERDAAGDQLERRAERVERQHHDLLAALAGARRQLLLLPRGDLRRSQERVPSRWVLEIAGHLSGRRWWSEDLLSARDQDREWLGHVASFDAGLRHLTFPCAEQEYRLRHQLAEAGAGRRTSPATDDPVLAAGHAVIAARQSRTFTRFDGNLAGLEIPSPIARPTSATRLEHWASCPAAYLLGDLLGVDEVENPEEQLTISPIDRGSLVHEVLERFVGEAVERPGPDQPRPGRPWTDADRDRLLAIAGEVCDRYELRGLTGRPVFWRRDRRRIIAELLHLLDKDDEHRQARSSRPIAAELGFGLPGAPLGTVAAVLPDGRCVEFRGRVDRVDRRADGTLEVVDYKTGSTRGYQGLSEADPDLCGRRLQLPVYGLAARRLVGAPTAPVLTEYWFISAKRGDDRIGYPLTPEVLDHFGRTLATIVDGIRGGVFPAYPRTTSTTPTRYIDCAYCDPDRLGASELRRTWERKREDPALAMFALLAEPDPDGTGIGAEADCGAEADGGAEADRGAEVSLRPAGDVP